MNSADIKASVRKHLEKRMGKVLAPEPERCDVCGAVFRTEREEFTPARFEFSVCDCEPDGESWEDANARRAEAKERDMEAWRLKR